MGYSIPVALIFFNRPDTLKKVFCEIRKVKPKQLFLIQDGPRAGRADDVEKIQECREIVENVDWECEVHKNYSEKNLGCGVRPSSGISWVLDIVDRTIILEDDCVPCESFFPYCEEMLNKYENDERISYVSGLNHFQEWDCGKYSYFFTKTGAIWGWATWRRAWKKYDYYVNAINDEYLSKILPYQITNDTVRKQKMKTWKFVSNTLNSHEKLSYWDIQWGLVKYSQNQLVIVPKYNQIHNIGTGETSTHATNVKDTQFKKYKNFFFIPTKCLEFPLVHPEFCIWDSEYDNFVYRSTVNSKLIYRVKKYLKALYQKTISKK